MFTPIVGVVLQRTLAEKAEVRCIGAVDLATRSRPTFFSQASGILGVRYPARYRRPTAVGADTSVETRRKNGWCEAAKSLSARLAEMRSYSGWPEEQREA
jgi:hypothetical protein